MYAWVVMRSDRKRWDSPISPPTHTHTQGDRLSGDKATGSTFLRQHACTSESMCRVHSKLSRWGPTETSSNQPKLLLTLQLLSSWSYCAFISDLSLSHSPYIRLSHLLSPHPASLYNCSCFSLHSPPRLSKFDAKPSVNPTNVAPHSFSLLFIWPSLSLSAGAGCHCDYRPEISLSLMTAVPPVWVCAALGFVFAFCPTKTTFYAVLIFNIDIFLKKKKEKQKPRGDILSMRRLFIKSCLLLSFFKNVDVSLCFKKKKHKRKWKRMTI